MSDFIYMVIVFFHLCFVAPASSDSQDYDNLRPHLNIEDIANTISNASIIIIGNNKQQSIATDVHDDDDNDPVIIHDDDEPKQLKASLNEEQMLQLLPTYHPSVASATAITTTKRTKTDLPLIQTLWFTNQQRQQQQQQFWWWSMQQRPPPATQSLVGNANNNKNQNHYPLPVTAVFKSINEHSRKLNKLKVFQINQQQRRAVAQERGVKGYEEYGGPRSDERIVDAGQTSGFLKSFEMYHQHQQYPGNDAVMRRWPNVAVNETTTITSSSPRIATYNEDNNNNKSLQQLKYLKLDEGNGLLPLSFGQLPQFQQQQQQDRKLFSPSPTENLQQQTIAANASSFSDDYHQKQQQQQLADYRLFFNAEYHTEFYLYTVKNTNNNDIRNMKPHILTTTPREKMNKNQIPESDTVENSQHSLSALNMAITISSSSSTNISNTPLPETNLTKHPLNGERHHQRVLNVVTDTISSVFGVNTRPVADSIPGIHFEQLQLYNARALRQSHFNPFNPTRILIHGWLGGSTAGLYNTLIPELLSTPNMTYNVITVDWGRGAIADYITASYRVKRVGKVLAKFIDFLHRESGMRFEDLQLIGFSMGAHVAGIAGKHLQTGRLSLIYALDPALPLFRYENREERLDLNDAEYVEVLHTSVGSYGYDRPLGHVDVYINYGTRQPGCYLKECSHFRAFKIFAQALWREELEGIGCSEAMWQEMVRENKCPLETGKKLQIARINGSFNKTLMARRRGVYYLLTNSHAPYGIQRGL
ncbi:uncharacterized protein [Musca autumnalis]|uniref:uncharacterized protein n=1 Tax=Musca autumnalis TaxID=221902 RepID=UPI003CF7EABA